MTTRALKILVLCGDGINSEVETAHAFSKVGFECDLRHLSDLKREGFTQEMFRREYSGLCLPGGFSYGDDLESGRVLALKIKYSLKWDLVDFARQGGMVLGICNGFQALIHLGVFGRDVSITVNENGKFQNSWVKVTPKGNRCIWLKGVGTIDLPIRHGEGRVVFHEGNQQEILNKLERQEMNCLKYEENPNGSVDHLAGICDPTGRIFGLMPHPEAFVRWTSHPEWTRQPDRAGAPGQGLILFENAYKELKGVQ